MASNQWTAIRIAVIIAFGAAITYGVFKGGISERVTANEKQIDGNRETLTEHSGKIDQLNKHAARSEADMEWMKKTVEDYDTKQEKVLNAIKALKIP